MKKLDKENVEDIIALSPMQEGILFHYLKESESRHYFEQLSLRISGEIDNEFFEKAWNMVIRTNEMLRTVFLWDKVENPVQIILKEYKLQPEYYNLSDRNVSEKKRCLEEIKAQDKKEKFDLREIALRLILCKIEEDEYEMIISNHHILYDGWSNGIILREFFNAYHALSSGKEWIKPVKTKYKEFIKWIQNLDAAKQEKFWRNYLRGFETAVELPVKRKKSKGIKEGGNYNIKLAGGLVDVVENFARKRKVTLASLLYNAWGILLQKYSESEDIIFGTTVSGRSAAIKGIENIVGLFINTLPLRIKSRSRETVSDLLYRVYSGLQEREKYENTSLADIKAYVKADNTGELFDTIVVLENYPLENNWAGENSKLTVNSYSISESTGYDLTVSVSLFAGIEADFIYNKDRLDRETVVRLSRHLTRLLEGMVNNPGKDVHRLDILTEAEKDEILYDFNDTGTDYPENKTLQSLFEEQVEKTPGQIAIVHNHKQLTYEELNKKSDRLACRLREKNVKADIIVGLMVKRSLEMIIGIMGILKAGGVYLPIDPDSPQERIDFMLKDSNAEILLSEVSGLSKIINKNEGSLTHLTHPTHLCYIIYTSGSTGRPKGVMVEHRGVVNYIKWAEKTYLQGRAGDFPLYSSLSFDLTVTSVFVPLLSGNKIVIYDDTDKETAVARIFRENRVRVVKLTPSHLKIVKELDISAGDIEILIVGGEDLPAQLAYDVYKKFNNNLEIYNEYGPTETVVGCMIYKFDPRVDKMDPVPIGRPAANTGIYLLDRHKEPVPPGVPGEIYISGAGVARGYLNRPELTTEGFLSISYKSYRSYGTYSSKKIYKTGDLARWLPGGNLEFVGRRDHQVKIRGYRVELGEIENRLCSHEDIKAAVVVDWENEDGDNYLCGYMVSDRKLDQADIERYLAKELPRYMIPSHFVELERIPLTASGKVDRKALPKPGAVWGQEKEFTAPGDEIEKKLVEIWSGVLYGKKAPPVSIGIDDNFFQLGGHSLKATILMSRIHKSLDVKVPLTEMFEKPTIREMAAFIRSAGVDRYASIELTEEKDYYVLSPAQERLYILRQMDENSTGYNVSAVLELEGDIEADRLEGAFIELIRRHESLRTSFHMAADRPVQRIHDEVEFKIENYSAGIIRDFFRPFDLSKAPLLRAGLMETGNRGQILMLDMHHIVSDAVSTEVFIKDFAAMYAGEELPGLKLRYKDYSEWQDRSKEKEAIKKQEEYWLNQFAEEVSVLDLPADYKRPAVQGFEGRTVHFETGIKETKALRKMVSGEGESLTMFMVLAAVYAVFLSKIGGSRDIVIGIPAAGGRHADLEQIIGVFVNTLPLRISLAGEQTLTALLNQVKERTLGAFDNREYQYEDLVEKVAVNRDVSRSPLFDVMLVMQDIDISGVEIPGLKLKPYEYEDRTSKFDLTLLGVEAGGKLSFGFEYSTRLFKKETIARFVRYFNKIVTAVVLGDRGQRISAIEIISQEEKQQILFDFNDTYCAYPQDKTIHELFAGQAARTPDRTAVIGITSVTYAELNRKSDRLACFLKEKGVEADTIVGIMTERSVEMVIGILGILKAGGAYLPIDPGYPEERINYMLNDSGTEILLTSSDLFNCQLSIVNNQLLMNSQTASKLAYIIYTSGSTGKPKGVMTEHRALVNRLNWMQKAYPIGEGDVILQKTPFIFDVSVWELFWWGIEGASLCLLEPGGEKSPEAIVEAVEKHKITAMHFVPSMLSVLLEYLGGPGDKRKLSSLRQVFSSGEALTVRHVERFKNVLAETLPIRLINLYGPTEAAIDVSYFNCVMEDIPGCIPIGRPIDNIRLIVVSKDMHVQPVGIAGELCIGGEGLARGYLNRPELTIEKFLFISYKSYSSERIYKTGDLTRWLWDGNIEFLGRIDFQVKIRGFRIELGEIESRLLGHEKIKEAVVLARGDGSGDHTIVAYIVAGRRLPATGLREYLSMELPDYMIPSYFVQLEKMPVTPNGKLDRNALPEPETRAGEEYSYSAPGNRMEEKLALMWAEVLQVPVGIGIDDNFFHLGGHSLKAAVLVSRVHKEFNVRVPLVEMFKKPTIRGLSGYIKGAVEDKCESIKPVEKKEYYVLSSAQKRLFILQQMHKDGTGYNMVSAAILEGVVEKDRVQDVFIRLIMRHESLRTSFAMIEDQPVQKIHEEENSGFRITTIMQDFVRPFELSEPPLLRVGLIETGSGKYILMVDMHHIISDGISLEIFLKEFMAVYAGEKLPAVELQYKDYSEWQDSSIEREEVMKQGEYWRKQFETGIPVLDLPTDYVRPAVWGFEGNRIHFEINSEQTAALNRLALREGGTLYMVLLAAYNIFLAKVSNREDIVVGTPAAGRSHTDLEQIIGVFVNTLALRNYPAGEKTFIGFLRQIKERTLEAFENQEYQYEELVEKTAVNRNVSRNPLFDVMFVMQEMNPYGVEVNGLKLIPFNYEKDTSLFDLILYVELAGSLRFAFEYSRELFKKETVERFIGYFKMILSKAVENPGIKISGIEIISEGEKKNLLLDFNHEIVEFPKNKTIHGIFEEQVERTPDNTAIVYENEQISYKELDRKANRLARYLKQKGVGSEIIVGLKVKRSIEMVNGIIGILKAGGAYLPIDPDYPEERINYMLKDSGTEILLTSADLSNCQLSMNSQPAASLAYIIYTSGTTGKPKGVMINQRNVVRLLINDKILFDFNENDVWTMFHSYCFDFSVWEMYGALFYGGKLVVVPKMIARDPGLFLEVLRKHDVTVLNQTPSAFYHLLDEELKSPPGKELNIKYIIFGGEALKPVKLKEWQKKYPGTKLVNMFGITETTVHVTYKEITPVEIEINSRSIGKQIPTSSLYILDRDMRLLPMGVPGELCVGGEGVGRGYLNRPELTADKFIENPYQPGEVLYRSGDLVRLIENGEMEYLGRIDHQVQVRGFRVEPGEIESRLLRQPEIKEAVVIDGEDKAGEIYLCAYITADEEMDIFKLRTILAKSLPGYMIPSYFMQVDHIPLTPNGKVDRRALPAPGGNAGKEYTAPGNEKEKKLAEIWSEVLLLLPGSIGIDDDFFELGGHSLKAAALAAKIHKEFDVKVPLVEIFKTPTIRGLCTYIKGAAESRYVSIPLAEKREYHSLSPAQKRLYILYQMEEGKSIVYNIPQIITMDAGIGRQKLEQAFSALIQRHESLRTSFHMAVNQPVQCIHDEVEFEIELHTPAFIRPFDLSKAPLLRVGLIEVKNGMHLLVVDMHHIVSDGVSMQLLVADFTALCKGEKLPLLRIQYKDYTLWQNREIERGAVKNQEEYWLNEFAGEIPVTDLPLDYPRPAVQSFAGSSIDLTIDSSETEGLRKLAKSGEVTLYMMLLAMFNVFTAKLSGNEDIVMGTPAAGRRHADLEPVIGMFVNTLPLRNYPSAQKPFNGFLYEVKEKTLKAFENQDYPFEELVENVSAARDISRNPLFDIMFNLQNQAEHTTDFPGKESYAYESRVSKFDMTLAGVEVGDELHFSLEYCTTLFKRETIERFIKYFKTMVSWILADPSGKIADIEIVSEKEKQWILYDFNHTGAVYPAEKTIHELFEEQAARTPDGAAVVCAAQPQITYGELSRKSHQLACILRERGVLADDIVGILVEPSIEMIIGILGILKSGAAYLPIDPGYPRERIDYMLKDSNARILVKSVGNRLACSGSQSSLPSKPSGLAYIIYTSGSTGQPKGVMVNHQPVINLLFYLDRAYPFGETDTYLLKTSYIFDVSVTELFGWFLNGGRLVVLPGGDEKDPRKILEAVARCHVTHINFVPSMFNAFVEALHTEVESIDFLSSLKYIFLAGEALKPESVNRFRRINPHVLLENLYGPTEAAVYASRYSLSDWGGSSDIPIGKPVQNVQLLILDRSHHFQPVGVTGELCIGGEGLARGYLNHPELTAERFCFFSYKSYRTYRTYSFKKIYKTGDLVRWLPDGNIEFLGRMDHQVKIRGCRIELEEIEKQLLRHESIIEAVVLEKGEDNDKYICAYIVPAAGREPQVLELRKHLVRTLPDYMIPAHFVQIENIPLTPSGKIDRRALPVPEIKAGEDYTAPGNETEKKLAEIWSDVLNLETGIIGIDANFFQLGGHSLKAAVLVSRIQERFNLRVPLAKIFKVPTVRGLAEYIEGVLEEKYAPPELIEPVEEKEYYALSSAQKRIYFFQQMDAGGTSHNMPAILAFEGVMDKDRLEEVIGKLIERHESFRTSFVKVDGEPVQKIHDDVEFKIEFYDLIAEDIKKGEKIQNSKFKIQNSFVRPFDLSRPPLLRVGLIKRGEDKHILLLDMHHIITDGTSTGIFIKDFKVFYGGENLPGPGLRYKDFSEWQNNRIISGKMKKQEEYWLKEFKEEIPRRSLPTDYPGPSFGNFEGNLSAFEIEEGLVEQLERLAAQAGTTMFMLLLAAYNVLLFKYTGCEDIVVGSPTAGRGHREVENIIGMFANMLALRNYPHPWKSFRDFLGSVKENSLKAFENRDYPFEMLVDKLNFKRDSGRSPLFDTAFTFHGMVFPTIQINGLKLTLQEAERTTTHFDLSIEVQEKNGFIRFNLEYDTQLFKRETIERLGIHFTNVLKAIAANPGIKVSDIEILSEDEKMEISGFGNLTAGETYDFE